MASQSGESMPRRFRARTVRGAPYLLGERTLTPEAKVIAFGRARATIRSDRVSAAGLGFAQITPVAILVRTPRGDQRIRIVDATSAALWRLGAIAAALLVAGACLRGLARRR